MNQGVMVGGRRPSVEDNLRWKMTSAGRGPLVEDDLQWKKTFGGRRPFLEDEMCLKTNFSGRCWILACCLLRFAAFFRYSNVKKELSHVSVLYFPFYK